MTTSDLPDEPDSSSEGDGVIRATFDWTARTPSTAVIEMVAIAVDREPTELEPMYEVIDPEALDSIVGQNGEYPARKNTTVAFTLNDHDITVRSDGTVVVRRAGSQTASV